MTGNRSILPVGGWLLASAALALFAFLWWMGAAPCRAVVSGNVELLSFFPLSISTLLFSDLDRLTAAVVTVVDETVQPAGVVVWLHPESIRSSK